MQGMREQQLFSTWTSKLPYPNVANIWFSSAPEIALVQINKTLTFPTGFPSKTIPEKDPAYKLLLPNTQWPALGLELKRIWLIWNKVYGLVLFELKLMIKSGLNFIRKIDLVKLYLNTLQWMAFKSNIKSQKGL